MAIKPLCLLFIVYINYGFCSSTDKPDVPEVDTPLGKIQGAWRISNSGRKFAAFEGIPFAKPPVGELRFEEPEPVEPWSEVLNATQTHTCPQESFFNLGQTQGEEDCLYLNVYVPSEQTNGQRKLDVLVSIHGGGFFMGSGHMMLDPRIVLDNDLVVVSINYRLGILGFLSTEDEAIPGNNGMKDQVLALRWVKDNIASFGGNPDSVTISGISAGAASVHLHYFSPLSKGLFARGLSHSGTALCHWAVKENALESAKKLAGIVGCPDSSTSELKQCLKEKPLQPLVDLKQFHLDDGGFTITFAPVIEKGSANPFLTSHPYLLLKNRKVQDVPWITSTTTDEGLLSTGAYYTRLEQLESDWPQKAHLLLDYNYTLPASKRDGVAKKIKDFYLGPGEHISQNNFKKLTQIFTDRWFLIGAEIAAKLQSRANKSPVYYYLFNYEEGENKLAKIYGNGLDIGGVGHGEDGFYFYISMFPGANPISKNDQELRTVCQNVLYSFATTGKPSFDGTDKWQPTTDSELVYLNITGPRNIELQRREHLAPLEFWRTLGLLENENLNFKDEL